MQGLVVRAGQASWGPTARKTRVRSKGSSSHCEQSSGQTASEVGSGHRRNPVSTEIALRFGWWIGSLIGVLGELPILAAEKPSSQTAEMPFCQSWDEPYQGENAVGPHVVGLWTFDPETGGKDLSGRGHDATVQGARLSPTGRFGGALECFPGWPVEDKPHRAMVPAKPDLSPRKAFSLELWICPKPELANLEAEAYLADKKYVAHTDYQLVMTVPDRSGARGLRMSLGFGQDSDTWYAPARRWEPGRWYHLAFTYDGQGTGVFYLNGVPISQSTHPGRTGIVPGTHGLSIGDRLGSRYAGFPGLIDQVRLCEGVLEFRPVAVRVLSDRRVFLRMEPDVQLRLQIVNRRSRPMEEVTVRLALNDMPPQEKKLQKLLPGQKEEIVYRLDTRLRPDVYPLQVEIFAPGGGGEPVAAQTIPLRIVPRPGPDRMPVVMWGGRPGQPGEIERLKRIGFTHALGLGVNYGSIFEAGRPIDPLPPEALEAQKQLLDEALAADLTIAISLSPGDWLRSKEQFRRVGRDGKPTRKEDICALYPGLDAFCQNVGISVARAFGRFPAFGAALVHSEVRDAAAPCFHEHDREAFRRATGLEIPPEVASPRGVDYRRLPQFPQDRVIPDDHPLLLYYRWYWKQGDGWNGLNTVLCRGLRTGVRPDFWIWHDPAVRVAKVYGSGGEVDIISQWTYTYPDPIRIGLATDELLTMAAGATQTASEPHPAGSNPKQSGSGGQQVMKMTQIIWYRSQTAPEPKKGQLPPAYQARWEIEQPDAPFITIAPMHLREAFWTKIARPIQGIMYHGWESLVPCEGHSSYRYTHPQTQHELARLIREVVEPLGPMLRQVPGMRSDVAMLESFTSEMFAGRGTFGWSGSWAGDCWHVLQWAHLQTDILFEETILAGGLESRRVLVMPDCDVLPRSLVERIRACQQAGGLIIGDDRLIPAIQPDILLPVYQRTGHNAKDKAALQALAAQLRQQLDSRYTRRLDTDHPDVIPYRRAYKDAEYVFLVNDRRHYGNYVGHHGLVMEQGDPSRAQVRLRRPDGVVYDLLRHAQVPVRKEPQHPDSLLWDVDLGPCEGTVFLVLPTPVAEVRLQAPEQLAPGESGRLRIEMVDAQGHPLETVFPLHVQITDPEARQAEPTGYWAAVDGRLELPLDIAPNDTPGVWQIEVRDLASGKRARAYFRLPPPTPWPPERKTPMPKEAAEAVQPKG